MKITKRQLRRIIKEEKAKLVSEASLLDLDDYEILENCVKKLIGYGYTKEDVAAAFNAMMETM